MKDGDLIELSRRLKAADHKAFEELFNFFQQPIYRFLLYKIKDPMVAEDLLQEVFVNLWKSRANLNENRSIKNYLYTIADNLVLNYIRHRQVVMRHELTSEARIFTNTDNPQFIIEEAEWNRAVAKAIESLPELTREIFLMSRIEDLSYQEIADRLSITAKAVEGHIVKALRMLRTQLPFKL
jgi:RNA polymerase sigma-70 factor (ECF subfamily)